MGRFLSLVIALMFLGHWSTKAQSIVCEPNTDFEYGNYSYWSFYQGTCCSPFSMTTAVTPPTAREALTSGTGLDPYGGFPVVAPGGSYSLKLGTNDMNYLSDRARYKVHVPAGLSNYALIYRYAIVMQDPGHVAAQQPRFTVSTIDSNTGNLVPCSQFTYVAGSLPGFSVSSVSSSVFYKPWSSAIINLSGYGGHTILIDFARGDCGLGGHFGYGYVDMSCGLFAISLNSCYTPGGTTTLTGPPGFKSYRWMDSSYTTLIDSGQIANIPTPSTSKTYRLIITPYPGYGCTDTLSARVNVSSLSIATRDTTVCTGQTLNLTPSISGAAGSITYAWSPTTGLSCSTCLSPSLTATVSRKYYFTATDTTGCAKTDSIMVNVKQLPNVQAPDKMICIGSATTLNATGASIYSWSPSTGLSCTACPSPTANPTITTTYVVTGIDSNTCVNIDTVIVSVKPLPNVVAPDKTICIGSSTTLNATGASTYSWSPSTGLSCTACASPTANPTVTTTYVVTGTDTNGCVNRDTVIVKVNPLPNVVAPDKTICWGSSTTLNATGASTYSWSPSTGLSCTACASPTANPTVTTTYVVTGTDTNSCVNRDTVIVKVNPLPNVVAPDKTICIGSSTTLNATGASTYSWSPSTGLSCTACANPTANPTVTTTYVVTGTDTNGCVNRDTVIVKVNPLPNVVAPDKTICIGSSTTLNATGASTYSWSPSTGLSCTACASPTANPTVTTTYVVTGTDTNGCVNRDTVIVKVNPLPNVVAPDKTICIGSSTTLNATGASTYSWSPSTGLSCTACANPTANPTVTTTYVVTGTDSNGCVNKDTVIVKVNPLPNVVAPDKTICIGSSTTLNATGASTYSWSPSTGLSCTACPSPTANPTVTTTYIVTGTDTNGCVNKDTVIVKVNPLPNVVAPDKTICIGSSTTLNATGASTYSWSPSTGLSCTACANPTANPTVTTTYVVTGTDSNGCVNKDTVIVKVNPLPNVVAPDKTICIGSSTTLNATGASTYSWSPSTGLSCTACPSPTANPTVTTTYIVTGTDTNGCVNKDTVIVKVNPLPNVVAPDKTICIGSSTTLNATGASTYSWSPSTGLSCTACANPTANPTVTTTYVVTGTDTNGCVNKDTVIVKVNPLPNVVAPDKTICIGSSTTLNATGASTYSWSPSTGLSCSACASPTTNPTVTTTYIVTGTDTNGCVNRDTVILKVNPLPNVVAPDKTICIGSSTTLNATGASTYSWSPSTGLSCTACANPTANPTVTTTYIVTGTDTNGCVNRDTVIVKVNPLPNVVAPDKTICIGSSTTLNATGASTYSWSPSTGLSCTACPSPTANPTVTTTYIVTGTDTNGCVNRDTVIVKVNPLPNLSTSNKTICLYDTVALTISGAKTYTWSPSGSLTCSTCASPKAFPKTTTVYSIIGVDSNGCSNNINCTVMVNSLPKIVAANQTICLGDSAILSASGAPSITWLPRTGIACPDCASTKAAPTKTSTYTIRAVDSSGCMNKDSMQVWVNALPTVESNNQSFCKGLATTISVAGAKYYKWSPSIGLTCDTCATTKAYPDSSTTYYVRGIDSNGCVNKDTIRVTVFVPLSIHADTAQAICKGDSTQLKVSGSKFYTWSPSGSLACSTCDSTKAYPTSTTNYTIIATDSNNCKDTAHINVLVYPLPIINCGKDTQICDGKSIHLNATGALSYTWKPANSLSCSTCDTTTAYPNIDTKYTVVGVDAHGCRDSNSISISLYKKKPISYSLADSLCAGTSVQLHANGGTSYLWIPATGLNNDSLAEPICTPSNNISYKVIIKQGNCFVDTGVVNLVVYPIPSIAVSGDTLIYKGEQAHLYSTGTNVLQYKWTPNEHLDCPTCPNPIAHIDETTKFLLVVKGAGDCENQDTITVKVKCDQSKVFIPNTFTPNGDGENDRFYPMGSGVQSIVDFMIYNRWGEMVYEAHHIGLNNPAEGWDGMYKGKALAPDVYIYYIHATCDGGDIIQLKGDISLVK